MSYDITLKEVNAMKCAAAHGMPVIAVNIDVGVSYSDILELLGKHSPYSEEAGILKRVRLLR